MEQAPFTETNCFSAGQKPFYFVQTTVSLACLQQLRTGPYA